MKRAPISDLDLRNAVRELQRIGLSVYGAPVNLKTREVGNGCTDYHAMEAVQLRRLIDRGATFWRTCINCRGEGCRECDGVGHTEATP